MNNGNSNNNNRNNTNRVRPVSLSSFRVVSSANQPTIYDIPFVSIVEAFEDCCRQKMSAMDCQRFLCLYQQELVRLWQDLRMGCYMPGKSKCFVVKWPVFREVFAADFADRIIHHWWALRVNPLYEERFQAQGNVSKNCRKGEGTLSAIKTARAMVDEHPDWWVGKFDFEGFFMSMDQGLLVEMTELFLRENYKGEDLECLLYVNRIVITHSPQYNCIRKSPVELWNSIPPRKTLFGQPPGKGCAIGNLPSQLNANFLGSVFDHWITKVKKVDCYVRFVDDFIILMPTRDEIVQLVPQLRDFLTEQLLVRLHPKKIYIQPVKHGFLFVGAYIHVGRSYISNRTRGKMYDCIRKFNQLAAAGKAEEHAEKFVASLNSYLGMMVHHNSYKIRRSVMGMLHKEWWRYIMFEGHFNKVILKKQYKPRERMKKCVRSKEYQRILTPDL